MNYGGKPLSNGGMPSYGHPTPSYPPNIVMGSVLQPGYEQPMMGVPYQQPQPIVPDGAPFRQEDGCPLEFPPPATSMQLQNGNATDEVLENHVCNGVSLRDVVLKNCHVTGCEVDDAKIEGGYFCSSKLDDCDVCQSYCLISCVVNNSKFNECAATNTHITDCDIMNTHMLDCKVSDCTVVSGRCTRSNFSDCNLDHVTRIDCNIFECDVK